MIPAIKRNVKQMIFSVVKPPPSSFSQAGEDAIIRFLFHEKKINSISYLDIGTNNPDYGNNSFLFYSTGSSGVCVEADPALIPAIKEMRPGDKVMNFGVSVSNDTEADFYVFDCQAVNTFDKEEADKRIANGSYKMTGIIKIPLVNINSLIKDNFEKYPDFLSLDIEGLDLAVLKTLDFDKYPLPVICAETCEYSDNHIRQKDNSIAEFLLTKGYEIYADTYINTIFVNKKWFYSL